MLVDDRGWHQSLSAWCVTAGKMIVEGDDRFLSFDHIHWNPRVHRDALDARGAWPPLLRPGVLMGHDCYATFEDRAIVDVLATGARTGASCADALWRLLDWAAHLRAWKPADGPLERRLHTPLAPGATLPVPCCTDDLVNDLIFLVPLEWRPSHWPHGLQDADVGGEPMTRRDAEAVLHRYVGTRLVGSWVAYQGEGLLSVVASLVSSYVLATVALAGNGTGLVTSGRMASALRAADWLQLHLLDREDWAAWCSRWETTPGSAGQLSGWLISGGALLDGLSWGAPAASGVDEPRRGT